MPPELAKKLSEYMNKKPHAPENDLQEAIDDMAHDIAILEPNPIDWGGWVSYMLEQLEGEAKRRIRIGDFEKMLRTLAKELTEFAEGGR